MNSSSPDTIAPPQSPVQKLEAKAHRGAAQRLDPVSGRKQQCVPKGPSAFHQPDDNLNFD